MYDNYAVLWNRIARRRPELVALRSDGQSVSYEEFEARAGAAATALRDQGLCAGDRVAFFLHNTVEYLVLFYACLKLEAIPVSINYRYRGAEVAALLAVARPAALVHAPGTVAVVQDALERVAGTEASPRFVVVAGGGRADGAPVREPVVLPPRVARLAYADLVAAVPASLPDPGRDAEVYIFTGGTTGTPKAVVWGIGDLLHIQQSSIYAPLGLEYPADVEAAVAVAVSADRPAVTTLPLAPFIHATALFSVMNTLALGGTVIINPDPSLVPEDVVRLIIDERVSRLIVAGDAVAVPIVEALETRLQGARSGLTSVISSGMRFSDETKRRIHRLGQVAIVDILASTEGGPYAIATTTRAEDLPARFRLAEDAVVLDEARREVQDVPGATGVLAYRGALPKGYLDDPRKSEESYPVINGVRHCSPGDYVRVDEHGFIELLGRGSSVVNTGGEKVFPGEVEEALLDHPAVTDAVVFGVPDPRWGERVAAVVAVAPGSGTTAQDLLDHVAPRLAGYKKPRTLVLRDTLERRPSGKLDMRAIKTAVADAGPKRAGTV
ncbi:MULTISPECIES: AMP-binding protein [Micrococcaceae]|uniref:AMP-binding protein n=1 Tax=Micrococcaceae TaxID=1268 RepID=UPI001622ECA5|nr:MULTISPECIES: AMP-binding protein [Micrococcaceae]MBB5750020.1 fatty-acyl-CoA synthase [Micrococcus sp. TA1]HRO30715.1 AMP-binding protein [Citricoccus sp.]HRO94370.1 AMP-binding protein [Citricoccus sp.]